MTDFEVALCHYDGTIEGGAVDPATGLLDYTQPQPDTRVVVLVSAEDGTDAENKAAAHFIAMVEPVIAWQRYDTTRDDRDRTFWMNDVNQCQIWMEGWQELPPGDELSEWAPTIYDIRDTKHPFVRPNTIDEESARAFDRALAKMPGERGEKMRGLVAKAKETAEKLGDALAAHVEKNPPAEPKRH
jgi:hypothetical protein